MKRDPDGTFSISGGADADKFEINSITGIVILAMHYGEEINQPIQ